MFHSFGLKCYLNSVIYHEKLQIHLHLCQHISTQSHSVELMFTLRRKY